MGGTSTDGVAIVQRLYEAFLAVDFEAITALVADDVVLTQDPALPWGGRYVGRDGIAEFGLRLAGTIESAVTHEQLFQAGDHVVQQGRTKGTVRANRAAFDIPECHLFTLQDDRIVEMQFFIDSKAMLAALRT